MASKERAVAAAFALQRSRKPYTSEESAQYSAQLIKGLREIASENHQHRLAHLLELAEFEARWLRENRG